MPKIRKFGGKVILVTLTLTPFELYIAQHMCRDCWNLI